MDRSIITDRGSAPGPRLSGREAALLGLVVETHVREARPVGSRHLVRNHDLALSPSTVRGVMFSLAEKGLLERRHPSAGREPTDRGYRYYVDHLMPAVDLIVGSPVEIARQAEFARGDRLRHLLGLLEDEGPLVWSLSRQARPDRVSIQIGPEIGVPGLEEMSAVSVSIEEEGARTVLGLLGPMRMHYPRAVALMGWLGVRMKEILGS